MEVSFRLQHIKATLGKGSKNTRNRQQVSVCRV